MEKITTYVIPYSNYASLTSLDKVHLGFKKNENVTNIVKLREIYLTHRETFQSSLDRIKNNEFELRDVSESTRQLYIPNLETFFNIENPRARQQYLLETVPSLNDRITYMEDPDSYANLLNPELERIRELENLPEFYRLLDLLNFNETGIRNSLLRYMNTFPELAERAMELSQNFRHDITCDPSYPAVIESLSHVFASFTYQETVVFFDFMQLNPKLSLLLMHPCLVFVSGNFVFLNFFLPLIASSTVKGPLYNWVQLKEDVKKTVFQQKVYKRSFSLIKQSYNFIRNNPSTTVNVLSAIYFFATNKSLLFAQPSNDQLIKITGTYREIVDKVPKRSGFERYGYDLSSLYGLVNATGTELGRIAGSFSTGIRQGWLDTARPVVKQLAFLADGQRFSKK